MLKLYTVIETSKNGVSVDSFFFKNHAENFISDILLRYSQDLGTKIESIEELSEKTFNEVYVDLVESILHNKGE